MRLKCLSSGIAILAAVLLWQVGTAQPPRPSNASLVLHGKYLVHEVAHCTHCHTVPDADGLPQPSRLLQGAVLGIVPKKKTKNWAGRSPDITSSGLAGKWSEGAMVKFLMTGVDPEGKSPRQPMPLFHLNARDARAVVLYLRSLPGSKERGNIKENSKGPYSPMTTYSPSTSAYAPYSYPYRMGYGYGSATLSRGDYSSTATASRDLNYTPADTGMLRIAVPDGHARVTVNARPISPIGSIRYYVTPTLQSDQSTPYIVLAAWKRNGRTISIDKTVYAERGQTTEVDFVSPNLK